MFVSRFAHGSARGAKKNLIFGEKSGAKFVGEKLIGVIFIEKKSF